MELPKTKRAQIGIILFYSICHFVILKYGLKNKCKLLSLLRRQKTKTGVNIYFMNFMHRFRLNTDSCHWMRIK